MLCEQLSIDLPNVRVDHQINVRQHIFLEIAPLHSSLNRTVLVQNEPLIIFFSLSFREFFVSFAL